jgi:hypothetical protein
MKGSKNCPPLPPKGGAEKPMPPVGKKGAKKGKPKAPKMPFGGGY